MTGLFTVFRANAPQLFVDLNRDQCLTMGVNPGDVFNTLQIYLGSFYVNDFNQFGRTWQVVVQAEGPVPQRPREGQAAQGAQRQGRHGAAGGGPDHPRDRRPAPGDALQHVSGRRRHRRRRSPASAPATASMPMRAACADQTLPKQTMGYEWTEINYLQIDAAKNIGNNLIFPAGGGAGVPGAGGPVRELGAAAGRHPGRADVHARLARRASPSTHVATSTSSRRSASSCWSAWPARTPS